MISKNLDTALKISLNTIQSTGLLRQKYRDYEKQCTNQCSRDWFANKKVGSIKWVTELGSSFKDIEPNLADNRNGSLGAKKTKVADELAKFGGRPFKCDHCEKRYKTLLIGRMYTEKDYPEFEWKSMAPAMDARVKKGKKDSQVEAIQGLVENMGEKEDVGKGDDAYEGRGSDEGNDSHDADDIVEDREEHEGGKKGKKLTLPQIVEGETNKKIRILLHL